MTDEDATAAKLKGYNCLVKFKDGEELFLKVDDLDNNDEDEMSDWFIDVEQFLNGTGGEVFPIVGMALSRDAIKYIRKI